MILVKPSRDSPMEQHLHLLFRWFDLYYIAYHCKGVWYCLRDDNKTPLPPASQLFYNKKGGVVDLPFYTTYPSLGGFNFHLGPKTFWKLYQVLMQSAELKNQSCLGDLRRLCHMALPAVAFSEAARFPQFMEWVSEMTALGENDIGEVASEEHTEHFNEWGSDSRDLFEARHGDPPEGLTSRLSILKTPHLMVKIPLTRSPHEMPVSESSEEEVEEV